MPGESRKKDWLVRDFFSILQKLFILWKEERKSFWNRKISKKQLSLFQLELRGQLQAMDLYYKTFYGLNRGNLSEGEG